MGPPLPPNQRKPKGYQVGPLPTLGVQIQREGKGPTCEYLDLMPIKDTDTGALKVLEGGHQGTREY